MFLEKLFCFLGSDGGSRFGLRPSGEIVDCHKQEFVYACCFRERSYYIHSPIDRKESALIEIAIHELGGGVDWRVLDVWYTRRRR